MRFDLIDLRLFLSVAERGSLTHGAGLMHLSLAAASERVTAMEETLGTPLLVRTGRGVRPTPAGEALLRHARLIVLQVEQMRGELRSYGTGLKGRIRVLCNTAAMTGFLPGTVCGFLLAHPDLSVDLEERTSAAIAPAVIDGRAELGIAADIVDLAVLESRPLAQDRLVVVVAHGHRLMARASVGFADVAGEPFVGMTDAALETHLAERAARLGLALHHRTRVRRVRDVGQLVAAGVGIAIMPETSAAELPAAVAAIPLEDAWAHRRLLLCAREFRALTPNARLLAEHLTQAVGSAPSDCISGWEAPGRL